MINQEGIKQELIKLLEEKASRQKYRKIDSIFPDEGPYRKDLYKKHIAFLNASGKFSQRAFVAANRVGKTLTGAFEMTCHLTGEYPEWWQGRKFKKPILAWAASRSNSVTRDVLQYELLGSILDIGSGMIPKDSIHKTTKKAGVTDAIETIYVKHASGGLSELTFKAYEQGRETFQGTKRSVIWLDEEPSDAGIFTESLTRTMGAGENGEDGIVFCTFTPLFGLSDVVLSFIPDGKFPENGTPPDAPSKFVVNVGWDDVPHINEEWKKSTLAAYSEHEAKARSQGIPALGSGSVFTMPEEDITVQSFAIPPWWPKAFGMDFGFTAPTAVVWGAQDPNSNIIYLYSEHAQAKTTPPIHAEAIKARGAWIQGACDPAGGGSSQRDGSTLIDEYLTLGLEIEPSRGGKGSKEVRISKVRVLLESGQLKVMDHLTKWLGEYRVYRYNEKGDLIKKNDHLMDATQYLISEFDDTKSVEPDPDAREYTPEVNHNRDSITGY